jgi:hypothetical protein
LEGCFNEVGAGTLLRQTMHNIEFFFASLVFMVVGRKLGWGLSKLIFYPAPAVISFIILIGWGAAVAGSMDVFIGWLHPNVVLKWILGFGLAAYVAIPNYGLFQEHTIPDDKLVRHTLIYWVPLSVYVATEVALRIRS